MSVSNCLRLLEGVGCAVKLMGGGASRSDGAGLIDRSCGAVEDVTVACVGLLAGTGGRGMALLEPDLRVCLGRSKDISRGGEAPYMPSSTSTGRAIVAASVAASFAENGDA